jgi:2-polyprenyl-6-hydroxyphenyl methylase/3-demethylubiquinone-9 3-methyltransferase
MSNKAVVCIWYDHGAEQAAEFYAEIFPNSSVGAVHKAPGEFPGGHEGQALTVEFTVCGIPCIGLNGGSAFTQSEAFSLQVITEDQAETDRLWDAVVGNGGKESMCGWCKDKWGVNWQITPRFLAENLGDPDRARSKRVFEAMMTMKKIDIAALKAAADAAPAEA